MANTPDELPPTILTGAGRAHVQTGRRSKLRGSWGLLMILPSIFLIMLFNYYPAFRSIIGSLTMWDGFNPPQFVGLANFASFFGQPIFWSEVRNLVLLVSGGTLISIVFPFLAAELTLSLPSLRGQNRAKYLFVIPMVIPQIILINIWSYLLNPEEGPIDAFLSLFRVSPIQWLSNTHTALLSILLIGFPWVSSLGYLVFLAGLQGISQEIFDASAVDGSVGISRMWSVDLPLSIPQLRFVVIIAGITMVQNIVPILLLTDGGPANATIVPGLQMYQEAFTDSQLGYGMAIGTLLFGFMLVISVVALRFLKPRT
jgi:ABC-type sugar transport system permease subunit